MQNSTRLRLVPARGFAILTMVLLLTALFYARGLASPRLIRVALAVAQSGGVLMVDQGSQRLVRITTGAGALELAQVDIALSLATEGDHVLVGCENGLYVSDDGGRTVRKALSGRHFTATAMVGADAAVVDWGNALYYSHDGARTWHSAAAPVAELQVNAIAVQPGGAWLAAGEAGVLRSDDQGASWAGVPGSPDRGSALAAGLGGIELGTWSGRQLHSQDGGRSWTQRTVYPAGIWAFAGEGTVATANGLFSDGRRVPGVLAQTEVVALARSGDVTYAAAPGSRLWAAGQDGSWRLLRPGIS